jgi:light-harvesting protein B-800-850 alpha chain
MNNAKMWLVVKPTVGIPLFLSAVAIGSFAVHVAVVSNTSWVGDFLQGRALGSGDQTAAAEMLPGVAPTAASYAAGYAGQEITVMLPDGTIATAIISPPETLASAEQVETLPVVQ